jgi:hypothetical protein
MKPHDRDPLTVELQRLERLTRIVRGQALDVSQHEPSRKVRRGGDAAVRHLDAATREWALALDALGIAPADPPPGR